MTEVERILETGFIHEEFLKEEVRDDYLISNLMKKTWAIQMDLLQKLVDVCMRNGLRVWVVGGTLLGAVRHKGFIPWDDDIDVIMPRNDYDRLLSIASSEFSDPYYLQSPFDRDSESYFPTARLCNSNTFLDHNLCDVNKITWNSGIFIDIFVLDGVPSSYVRLRNRFSLIKKYSILLNAFVLNINKHWLPKLAHKVMRWPFWGITSSKICNRIHRIARRTPFDANDEVVSLIATPYALNRNVFAKNDWRETIWLPFENMNVPAPCGFDGVLKVSFGDYMQFPPKEKRGVWHHFEIDPDTPYTEVIRRSSNH